MKNIIYIFLFLFSSVSLFAQYPFGDTINDGLTAETAYRLSTKAHLMELGDSIDVSANIMILSIWHFGKHFRLMRNITDTLRESIGNYDFGGHFHGGGHRVDSVIIDGYLNDYDGSRAGGMFLINKTGVVIVSIMQK